MEEVPGDQAGSPLALVAARNEVDSIAETILALRDAFPGVRIWVADDASSDGTGPVALAEGAEVVTRKVPLGKGGNVTACARQALGAGDAVGPEPVVLLLDADLGRSADQLTTLVEAVRSGECDLAVAAFRRRVGGGFGIALGFARWAIRNRCGFVAEAPISGQRAMRAGVFERLLPFDEGWGMEVGMTIDAVRAGLQVREYELELSHRATGRNFAGFLHRLRQLGGFVGAWWRRR
ncbi:MAG: glycosyltransferase family 2 protein [Solirubrobacterales bacterium]